YILQGGGFTTGGNNFDAKVRRQSIEAVDLFYAHIGGVDTVARGLLNAAAMIERGELAKVVTDRYAGWQSDPWRAILAGQSTLEAVSDAAVSENVNPQPRSGRQELIENLVSRYI